MKLDGYIVPCKKKKKNPILDTVHCTDPNLLVTVATFENSAGQKYLLFICSSTS